MTNADAVDCCATSWIVGGRSSTNAASAPSISWSSAQDDTAAQEVDVRTGNYHLLQRHSATAERHRTATAPSLSEPPPTTSRIRTLAPPPPFFRRRTETRDSERRATKATRRPRRHRTSSAPAPADPPVNLNAADVCPPVQHAPTATDIPRNSRETDAVARTAGTDSVRWMQRVH